MFATVVFIFAYVHLDQLKFCVLMVLGMCMFLNVMSLLMSVRRRHLSVCVPCCAYDGVVRYFWCLRFM